MQMFRYLLIGVLGVFLTSCGSSENQAAVVAAATTTLTANAGVDKRAVVNESVTLVGSAEKANTTALSYEWKKDEKTLSTSKEFTYIPTEAGIHLLSFTVQESDGTTSTDNMIVIVTQQIIDTNIPDISNTTITSYLNAVNKVRTAQQDCGLKGVFPATTTVSWNEKLYKASYEHMQDLIASKTFAHSGSGTESDWSGYVLNKKSSQIERVESYAYSWERLGENLAGGASIDNIEKAVDAWIESDNHCENLMNPLFTEVGVALVKDEDALYVNYWGQNFGTPK